MAQPNVTITFGANNPRHNEFLNVNGTALSPPIGAVAAVGTLFMVGTPMQLVLFTFHKGDPNQSTFQLIRNFDTINFDVNGIRNVVAVFSDIIFRRGDAISLRTLVLGQSVMPGAVLLSLFCRALPEQAPLYAMADPDVNILTFGGNNVNAGQFLRYNGNATTPATVDGENLTYVAIPSSAPGMHFFRMTWHKSTRGPSNIVLFANNFRHLTLSGNSGTMDLDFNMYRQSGEGMFVMVEQDVDPDAVAPGSCLLTFYSHGFTPPDTTPINCIDMANSLGTVVFAGNITAPGNIFRANGNATSPVHSQPNVVGNVFPLGVTSRTCYMSYTTQFGDESTIFELLYDDGRHATVFNLGRKLGAYDFHPLEFEQGKNLQLRFVGGTPPGQSVVSFFMSQV
jgi:hypothetical protein